MPIQDVLAKIAKGPKASKDLTWEECKQAMKALIEGEATPAQVGAFLIAMRFKTESVTELAALTVAARQYVPPLAVSRDLALVDVPSYAGKQDTFHALIAASIVAVAAGAAVLMHGYDGIPGRPGSAGVLKALGVPVDADPKSVTEDVNRKGFAYLDIGLYHPPVFRFWRCVRSLVSETCSIRLPDYSTQLGPRCNSSGCRTRHILKKPPKP